MTGSPTNFRVEVLTEDEWSRLRDIRLTALQRDPRAFLSTYEREAAHGERHWRDEFSRGEWNVVLAGNGAVGLLGVTREDPLPTDERYLEYLWVAEKARGSGAAPLLVATVLDRLRGSGIRTVWLWILDGNDRALRFYQRFGFQRTNERQPVPDHPAGSEERMRLRLR